MAQKKAQEVEAWLARPSSAHPIVLIYGPDRGLVSERAAEFVRKLGFDLDDPFAVVRLDATAIDTDPGRLMDEVQTMPMFADRRLVWVRGVAGQRTLAAALKDLCARPPASVTLLLEGGDLKKGSPVRVSVETGTASMALPCYVDHGRAIETIIDEVLERDGVAIAPDARHYLKVNLGGDRLASRAELEKLTLYTKGELRVELHHVRQIVGDVSARSVDDAVDSILDGDVSGFDTAFSKWTSGGQEPFQILAALLRQMQQLQALRAFVDAGAAPSVTVAAARPPIFFARKGLMERALQRWTSEAVAKALDRLQATILATRSRGHLEQATARQALMAVTMEARRLRQP